MNQSSIIKNFIFNEFIRYKKDRGYKCTIENREPEKLHQRFFGKYRYCVQFDRIGLKRPQNFNRLLRTSAKILNSKNELFRRQTGWYFYTNHLSDFKRMLQSYSIADSDSKFLIYKIQYSDDELRNDQRLQKNLPYKKYRYAISIRWGKFKTETSVSHDALISVCKNNTDSMYCRKSEQTHPTSYTGEYATVYVLNEKTLNYIKLAFGESITNVLEYITDEEFENTLKKNKQAEKV